MIDELKKIGISNPEEWKLGDLLKYFEAVFACQSSGRQIAAIIIIPIFF